MKIENKEITFHKKLHTLFNDEELKIISKDFSFKDSGFCSGFYMADIDVEIFCDCSAKDKDRALIYSFKDNRFLSKEEFFKIYR